jgi:hypothetical protein
MNSSPIWISIVVAIIAGLSAAVLAPLVTAALARRDWRAQKLLELKHDVFAGSTAALAAALTDALDVKLQKEKPEWKGMSRPVEYRSETFQALEQYRGLVAAFFSAAVADKYDRASRAMVSFDTIPNTDFEAKRAAFVVAASAELGLKG